MKAWFTRPDAPICRHWIKRFDPCHWTVDFPRGAMASLVPTEDGHGLEVRAHFLRQGDLVGVIFDSCDRFAHPAHRRQESRDYRGCRLSFRWQGSGLIALDAVNGPTLTIEGRDEAGAARSWYVRLWNYAQGSPSDARITLDFDALDAGFAIPADASRVWPRDIDRMFISLVPPGYVAGSEALIGAATSASLSIGDIRCDGPGSVLAIGDAVAVENGWSTCTAYDDCYPIAPQRIAEWVDRLGYRGPLIHYVGMSHFMALGPDGKVDPASPMNAAALAWHRAFAAQAAARSQQIIWSLSFEILEPFCPEAWRQRFADGTPARTGYEPPSNLVSPAHPEAIAYLGRLAALLAELSVEAGMPPIIQVGEPWWWVAADGRIALYDAAAASAFSGGGPVVADVRGPQGPAARAVLDAAGEALGAATASIVASARAAVPEMQACLLLFLPGVFAEEAPEVRRANCPPAWASPAYDLLQVEDYDWLTAGRTASRRRAYREVEERLGYPPEQQHYLAGYATSGERRGDWPRILAGAREAQARGSQRCFLWALPQIVRDGLTLFGKEDEVEAFDDVDFPIAIGAEAAVAPEFATQIVTSAGGHEWRNADWAQARLRFDAGPGVRGDGELGQLIAFYRARRGPAIGFRFRDPFDHSSAGMTDTPSPQDQWLGEGDGVRTGFALAKSYGSERRRITRPVAGSVRIAVDGLEQVSGWTLEPYGLVRFDTPPPGGTVITGGYRFDVPVRFVEDRLEVNRATFRAGEAPSVPLVEIREGGDSDE